MSFESVVKTLKGFYGENLWNEACAEQIFNHVQATMQGEVVKKVREELNAAMDRGVSCPVCGQFCKKYDRQVHKTVARGLITMYRMVGGEAGQYVHINDVIRRNGMGTWGDFSKARMWGVILPMEIEGKPANRAKKSGMWALTEFGVEFVLGRATIPRYAIIFNNTFYGFKGTERMTIKDCLTEEFDYDELMGIQRPVSAEAES